MFYTAFLLIALATTTSAKYVAPRRLQLHESRPQAPPGFELKGPADAKNMLDLRIALAQNDLSGLEKALMDVSTPGSALYGQHLSKAEVEGYVEPKPEAVSAVTTWLGENGINATSASSAGDWLKFSIPVHQANDLFNANYSEFTDLASGNTIVRTLAYSIPMDLKGSIELIHPTTTFTQQRVGRTVIAPMKIEQGPPNATDYVPSSCGTNMTPACLQALYSIPTSPATVSTNQIAVTGFFGQYANQADLQEFLSTYRTDIPPSTTFILETLDGGSNPQGSNQAGIEANLDIQYTVGIATNVSTIFISVGSSNTDDFDGFLDIINYLLDQSDPPQVLTTSYGFDEPELSPLLANNLCNAYMQLGARGTSILFASGDSGVGSDCTTFVPDFPASCPYVTAVGGTQGTPEVAAEFNGGGSSGGGFSSLFARPSWQDSAVSAYLDTLGSTNAGLFNASGRAYPDVAAIANFVPIVWEGNTLPLDGTSCASPIFASVIALLNDELAAVGRPPLGFLNPFLYSTGASALNDITSGNNPGCNTDGFPASVGWDPVTGLGTPNYAALKTAVGL